jgi:hypothetical protein
VTTYVEGRLLVGGEKDDVLDDHQSFVCGKPIGHMKRLQAHLFFSRRNRNDTDQFESGRVPRQGADEWQTLQVMPIRTRKSPIRNLIRIRERIKTTPATRRLIEPPPSLKKASQLNVD